MIGVGQMEQRMQRLLFHVVLVLFAQMLQPMLHCPFGDKVIEGGQEQDAHWQTNHDQKRNVVIVATDA